MIVQELNISLCLHIILGQQLLKVSLGYQSYLAATAACCQSVPTKVGHVTDDFLFQRLLIIQMKRSLFADVDNE